MFHHLRRTEISQALYAAEPTEYSRLVAGDKPLSYILISAATAALPADETNLTAACRQWLQQVAPADRTTGWLHRFAGLLLAARSHDTLPSALQREIRRVRLRQAAYLLTTAIATSPARAQSTLTVIRNTGISNRSTPKAALTDINHQLKDL